jgi:hypothetical protein
MNKTELIKGYKQSPLGPIPAGWEVRRIADVAEVKGGFAFDSSKLEYQEGIK